MSRYVVKMGGHALDDLSPDAPLLASLGRDLRAVCDDGHDVVLVHGGGPQIAALLERLGVASEFREGLRVTSSAAVEVVAMALAQVNVALVSAMNHAGLSCVGLSGADAGLTTGESLGAPWDRAGRVHGIDPAVLEVLWRGGLSAVVSPLALDDRGDLLNCNADAVAGALAGAIEAHTLVMLSDIDQVRADPDDPASALARLDAAGVREMIATGAARDGMRPKLMAALEALDAGARRVVLANGTRPHALRDVIVGDALTTEILA